MATHIFSSKLPNTGKSIFSEMSARAREANAINLSQGFPNFDCDPQLVELVSKHMKQGKKRYTPIGIFLSMLIPRFVLRQEPPKPSTQLYQL
jgi:methionine aminotransferase